MPPGKRIKREELDRETKEIEVLLLEQQLQEARRALENIPVKSEMTDDNAFRDMVNEFAEETQLCPFSIEDSP